ncbi:hypothetical protein [Enterovirga sp. CN4-39]|uniref:hypothetical protein n=1 Tax=Enterovirga sp. CN4-39 TaxID=3400910 RepID=UPI003BFBC6DD
MTKDDIEAVLERVRTWPLDRQAYAAFLLQGIEREVAEPYELTPEEMVELDQAEASGVASTAEVEALLGRYR